MRAAADRPKQPRMLARESGNGLEDVRLQCHSYEAGGAQDRVRALPHVLSST